jgi:hypothetical protein
MADNHRVHAAGAGIALSRGEEEALVSAARLVLWAFREPLRQPHLPAFSIASLLLLEEALQAYSDKTPKAKAEQPMLPPIRIVGRE